MTLRSSVHSADGAGRRQGPLALLVTVLIWGSTFIVTKSALNDIGPLALTFLRFFLGSLALWPFARRAGFRPCLSTRPAFLWFGLTGVALFYGLQNVGLVFTSASNASLIEASVPAATAVAAYLLLRERLTGLRLTGVALTVAGVLLVAGSPASNTDGRAVWGNLLIVGAVVCWALYSVQGRRLSVDSPPLVSTAAGFGAGLLFLMPAAAIEVALTGVPHLSLGGAAAVLYLGVVATALPLFLWNYALQYVEASAAALYTSLVPIAAVGLAAIGGEAVRGVQLAGGALAVAGVWVGDWLPQRRRARLTSKGLTE